MTEPKRDIIDEEDAEAQKAHGAGRGIPLTWKSGGKEVSQQSMIRQPSLEEQRLFTCTRVRTCGQCQHFKHSAFQRLMPNFMAKLIHEYQWNPRFLGDNPTKLGCCGEDPELVVGPSSLGCSAFKAK